MVSGKCQDQLITAHILTNLLYNYKIIKSKISHQTQSVPLPSQHVNQRRQPLLTLLTILCQTLVLIRILRTLRKILKTKKRSMESGIQRKMKMEPGLCQSHIFSQTQFVLQQGVIKLNGSKKRMMVWSNTQTQRNKVLKTM